MTDMYIASCHKNGGIYHYLIEGDTVTEKQFLPLDRPMYMELKDGRLYAVLRDPENNGNSGIVDFKIDAEGNLTQMGEIVSSMGAVGCHLTVKNGNAFVANYVSGSVFRTPDILRCHSGKGFNPLRQEASHIHCTVLTPDGKYICVADLGLDKVYIYDLELNLINTVDFPLGAGPRHIVFSEDGGFMYCVTELSNEVYTFGYSNGECKPMGRISTLPEDFKGQSTAAAIRICGEHLYASNRGHNSIAQYKLEKGIPKNVNYINCGGIGPRDFNIMGDLLVSTNENSNDVTFFNVGSGKAQQLNLKLQMPCPLNVIFKER